MKTFTQAQLLEMERIYRAKLVNSLGGYKSLCVLGTCSLAGIENLCIINSVVQIGANPPYLGFIFRPHTVERHSLENILEQGHFTLNHIGRAWMDKAHQTGAKYERETSEFEAVGLTPAYEGDFPVPYVLESPLRMGLALAEKHELAVNGTILIAGSLQWVSLDDEALHPDGFVDLERLGSIAGVSLDGYYQGQLLERYDYPRPGEVAQPLEYPRSGKQT